MLSFLKNHPFSVNAFFESSTVLTFCIPKEELQTLIPECLELDTFNDKWGFIALAMVKTKNLRPSGFPQFLGNDFFLIGYRVFVKYHNEAGKRLRGLYILKSETDKKKMEWMGNMFTHYNYTTTDISHKKFANEIQIASEKSNFNIRLEYPSYEVDLPKHSPFANWKEARRFAGPLPFTFTYNQNSKEVLIIEGVRENWIPNPVSVLDYNISFLKKFNFSQVILANAFIIQDIPYHWKKGKIEKWSR